MNFVAEETKKFSEIKISETNPHLANCLITASNLDLKEKIGQGSIGKRIKFVYCVRYHIYFPNCIIIIFFSKGEFGIVYRGILAVREKEETNLVPVAVKTLKSTLIVYYVSIDDC